MEISQNWIIRKIDYDKKFPFVVIDNWYNKEEEILIWQELDYLFQFFKNKKNEYRSENNEDVARDNKGISKSNSYRLYLDNYYTDKGRQFSHILNFCYKQKMKEFHSIIKDAIPMGRLFSTTNFNSTMLTYYDKNDFYEEHFDESFFTCLIWMHKEPKSFSGGDLELSESNKIVKIKNNRMILFPSFYLHKSTVLDFLQYKENLGLGKFTITHFYNINN